MDRIITKNVSIDKGFIQIQTNGYDAYEIPLSRVTSHDDLLRWIWHLAEKTWFTKEVLRDLMYAVYKHYGWELAPTPG